MAYTDILIAVCPDKARRYFSQLSTHEEFRLNVTTTTADALAALADVDKHADLLVLDNAFDGTLDLVSQLRLTYPRLLIVLVDEEADFALPGQADDISTDPFSDDDLARRINRLMSDRRLETLRADVMPPVREVAKKLRKAAGEIGKLETAISACQDLGFDYVAFYRIDSPEPIQLSLKAQEGPAAIQAVAPRTATEADLIGWVAKTGQSQIAAPSDEPNHPLVKRGRLGAVVCVPVGSTSRYGVIAACNDQPGTITQQQVMLLELISAQLASVVSKG